MARLKEIDITLEDPIEYANTSTGEQQTAETITLVAPASKHRAMASRIKNFCGYYVDKHLAKARKLVEENKDKEPEKKDEKPKKEGDDKFDGKTLEMVLTFSDIEDETALNTHYDLFQKMLEKGCGSINGTELSGHLFDKLSFQDMEHLFNEYAVNFLLDSLVN